MRVLVTGWAGYVGPHVIEQLRLRRHYVIGLDTGWFLRHYAAPPVYPDEALFMDLRDAWREDWSDVDCIVHLAGLSNDPMAELSRELTNDINFLGTTQLIGVNDAKRHVIASSCSVYGTAEMADEETPPNPLSEYAKAKANVDRFVEEMGNAVSLRFGTLYGWSPGHRLDLVVNRMCWDAAHGRGVRVNGNAARPLTHVRDAASAIVLAVEDARAQGPYNVVGENWRMQDLGRAVAKVAGCEAAFRPGGADARDYSAKGERLAGLGWRPRHTVEGTLMQLYARSFAIPYDKPHVRLDVLQSLIDTTHLTPELRRAA